MLNDFGGADHISIKCGYTDLRRGINGLAALVKQEMEQDPFSNSMFLFCGRRRDRNKTLYWEGNGFVLLYKRMESGSFQWPRTESEARSLSSQQYPFGTDINQLIVPCYVGIHIRMSLCYYLGS